jgi:hypothetical protein
MLFRLDIEIQQRDLHVQGDAQRTVFQVKAALGRILQVGDVRKEHLLMPIFLPDLDTLFL